LLNKRRGDKLIGYIIAIILGAFLVVNWTSVKDFVDHKMQNEQTTEISTEKKSSSKENEEKHENKKESKSKESSDSFSEFK